MSRPSVIPDSEESEDDILTASPEQSPEHHTTTPPTDTCAQADTQTSTASDPTPSTSKATSQASSAEPSTTPVQLLGTPKLNSVPPPFRLTRSNLSSTHKSPAALQLRISQIQSTIQRTRAELTSTLDSLSQHLPLPTQPGSTPNKQPPPLRPGTLQTLDFLSPDQQTTFQQAQSVLDDHVKALGRYNEMKDIGMMMLRLIAEKDGKTTAEVMEERGVSDRD